jgi:SAM-dependent methyltransferase
MGAGGGHALTDDLWALRRLARARRLHAWMFSALRPNVRGPMLDVGAGIGTFSASLLEAGADPLVLIEPHAQFAAELRRRFADDPRVSTHAQSLPDASALEDGRFRFALCQNVLEHIDDDRAALSAVVDALEPGGELAVLVPAHPALTGRLDRRFGHCRRYTRDGLRSLVADAGAVLDSLRSFNLLGVPGWWLAGRTDRVDITEGSLRLYEALVPLWRPVEERLRLPVGLSLVARAHRRRS